MTSPIIPEFILGLFQTEINNIVKSEIKKVCTLYNLDYDEVITKLKRTEIKTTENAEFYVIKKRNKVADETVRCKARMLRDLEIKQCSYKQCHNNLCGKHNTMHKNNKLKYGLIDDPIPDELRPEVLNEKKKTTIY